MTLKFCLLVTLCFSFIDGSFLSTHSDKEDDYSFDLLIFTQSWPITVCREWKEKNPAHECSFPEDFNTWDIHGIWPTRLGTLGPQFCNKTWHFDPEIIRPIEKQLTEFWANIEEGTSTYAFWAHEWNKHGTCAASLPEFNSELKYFKKGLEWLDKFNMTNILSEMKIYPDNDKEYSISDINTAIKLKLNIDPVIECRREKGVNYLLEIRICFDKTLMFTNCDGVVHNTFRRNINGSSVLTNCKGSDYIKYPNKADIFTRDSSSLKRNLIQIYRLIPWMQWLTL